MSERTNLGTIGDEGRKLLAAIVRAGGPITVPLSYLTDPEGYATETIVGDEVIYGWVDPHQPDLSRTATWADVPDGNGSDE